ncbi:MAG: DUF86 domain-containing protein [Planctomycetes bacterium]|nr:DUF86 domain-containing protein [Planctomycetota bacterium]
MPLGKYLADSDARVIAERHFQIAVQCPLDIGNHIVAEQGLGTPDDAGGILDCLERAGVVTQDLHERTRGLAGFRNVLVHDYLDIDHHTVHALLQRVSDLVELGRVLGDYVDRPDRHSGDPPRH